MTTRGENLAQRRVAMGHSQTTLAKALGVTRQTVSRWECGILKPAAWTRPRLARTLNVTLDQLECLITAAAISERQPELLMTVDGLRQRTQQLDEQYDHVPSTSLLAQAGHVLAHIAVLREQMPASRARRDLHVVEVEAETLMGQLVWDASQRRDHISARQHYDKAVAAAREIGNAALEGHALLRKSYVALSLIHIVYKRQPPASATC